jgi:purine-binding chemotaxis protein CheW
VETVSLEAPVYKAGKYLTFRVARQEFAMNAENVRAILPMHEMVTLDPVHHYVCGFASAGGRDFPVVDLRAKLGIPPASHGREPFIVGVEVEGKLTGFIADRVAELIEVRPRDLRKGALRGYGRPRRLLDPAAITAP